MSNTSTEYRVYVRAMHFDTCGGHNVWEIDGMSDPMELWSGTDEAEALRKFELNKNEARDTYQTEKMCGGFPEGYAVVVEFCEFEVDEDGEKWLINGEIIDMVTYTCDDDK